MLTFALLWARAHRAHRLAITGVLLLGLSAASQITSTQFPTFYDPLLLPLALVIVAGLTWQNVFPAADAANPGLWRARLVSASVAVAFAALVVWVCAEVSGKEQFLGTALRSLTVSAGVYSFIASVATPTLALSLTAVRVLPAMVLLPEPGSAYGWVWWEYSRGGTATLCVGLFCVAGLTALVRRGPRTARAE